MTFHSVIDGNTYQTSGLSPSARHHVKQRLLAQLTNLLAMRTKHSWLDWELDAIDQDITNTRAMLADLERTSS